MRGFAKIASCFSLLALTVASLSPLSDAAPLRMVSGEEALQRVRTLTTEIPWYTSLSKAQTIARQQDKPIFWVHMLGPLNGLT